MRCADALLVGVVMLQSPAKRNKAAVVETDDSEDDELPALVGKDTDSENDTPASDPEFVPAPRSNMPTVKPPCKPKATWASYARWDVERARSLCTMPSRHMRTQLFSVHTA